MRYLSVKEVMEILNISRGTAYKLFNDEYFPSVKIGSSQRVLEEDFKAWLRARKRETKKKKIGY